MAVETRDRRMSFILLDLPFGGLFPDPDGAIAGPDLRQWLGVYRGMPVTFRDLTTILMKYLPSLRGVAVTPLIDSDSELTRKIVYWRNNDTFTDTPTVIARALS